MARDHARIHLDIWGDDDWMDLSSDAQHLYWVLYTHPNLSFCGAGEWHPGRLSTRARDLTTERVNDAATELIQNLFLHIDPDTDEFLLRSWIKHDGLYRVQNMAVSMANARADLASRDLRGIVVHEVSKLRNAEPELQSWKRDQVSKMLAQKAIDPVDWLDASPWARGKVSPSPSPSTSPWVSPRVSHPSSHPSTGDPSPGSSHPPTPAPAPAPAPYSSSIKSGYVSTEGYDASATNPPPRHCPQHIDEPTTAPCRACGEARRAREVWDRNEAHAVKRAQSSEAKRRAELIQDAIDECELCDERGYLDRSVCEHNPERAEINRRGAARVREALDAAKRKADDA